ncbi:hypothetical protein [Clostridium cylindrosporum]|uniref:Uncharacterized protein n=1 Tax=Clostridium cylindrosporum DSM 605 TaxID=1121307 RepID=A0A0J8DAM1_CLOCY|nr:hypothetical protein [Clostridium cylindrosporum]KMT23080.1 hypothetical protein CLCY_7c01270 [Clostridium cylindrosporum DSM 605]
MDISILLGKTLSEAKELIGKNIEDYSPYEFIKILSPKEDIIGHEERVIKVEKKDKIIIYYSLF